ncbi:MAG: hypothetical protein KA535_08815 [Azonexus sp.]|nr:hypothetical protein [Azonexus sp.]
MTLKSMLTAAALASTLSFASSAALAHAEHGQAQYGGVVAEAGEAQFEIVGKDGRLTVYATNHGVPVDTAGASARLTVLAGSAKSEFDLKPAGDNRLQGQGSVAPGAKLLINVQWPGRKPLQARAVMQ